MRQQFQSSETKASAIIYTRSSPPLNCSKASLAGKNKSQVKYKKHFQMCFWLKHLKNNITVNQVVFLLSFYE